MATSDDIARERQRLSERLAKLDAERERLAHQLGELETTERVLSRFGKPASDKPRRGRPPRTAANVEETPAEAAGKRSKRKAGAGKERVKSANGLPLIEATLRAVVAHPNGANSEDLRTYLSREFGIEVRPNHLGMALQRHRRAGRLEKREDRWWPVDQAESSGTEPSGLS